MPSSPTLRYFYSPDRHIRPLADMYNVWFKQIEDTGEYREVVWGQNRLIRENFIAVERYLSLPLRAKK